MSGDGGVDHFNAARRGAGIGHKAPRVQRGVLRTQSRIVGAEGAGVGDDA